MSANELKEIIFTVLDTLPEDKLVLVSDFVQFLAERELQASWINAQSQSKAYQEWVSDENDVYDKLFADLASTR